MTTANVLHQLYFMQNILYGATLTVTCCQLSKNFHGLKADTEINQVKMNPNSNQFARYQEAHIWLICEHTFGLYVLNPQWEPMTNSTNIMHFDNVYFSCNSSTILTQATQSSFQFYHGRLFSTRADRVFLITYIHTVTNGIKNIVHIDLAW